MVDSTSTIDVRQNASSEVKVGRVEFNRFISRLFGILTCQLLSSALLIYLLNLRESTREWFYDQNWLSWLFLGIGLTIFIMLSFVKTCRITFPHNLISLFLMTANFTLFAAARSAIAEIHVVYLAFFALSGSTAIVCCVTKCCNVDATGIGFVMAAAVLGLLSFSVAALIASRFAVLHSSGLILCCISVIFMSVFLTFMSQQIPLTHDYILATILIHVTISSMAVQLLALMHTCFLR